MLQKLQDEAKEQDRLAGDLQENKLEFTAAIKEAERVREASRGVSLSEITSLKRQYRCSILALSILTRSRIYQEPRRNVWLVHRLGLLFATDHYHDLQVAARTLLAPSSFPGTITVS